MLPLPCVLARHVTPGALGLINGWLTEHTIEPVIHAMDEVEDWEGHAVKQVAHRLRSFFLTESPLEQWP